MRTFHRKFGPVERRHRSLSFSKSVNDLAYDPFIFGSEGGEVDEMMAP